MKILFVIKLIEYGDYISISYMSSMVKQKGHTVDICVLDTDDIFKVMKKMNPDIIAYSANVLGYESMVEVNNILKKSHSYTSIMGGPRPTFCPELFSSSGMDAFCIGEGELPFVEFVDKVDKGESFDDVLNLITVNKINPLRDLIDNLDDLPMPDRALTIDHSFLKDSSKKSVFTSRGCMFSCAYCCNNYYKKLYKGKGKVLRRFSVGRIIDEIKMLKKNCNVDFVKIGDDLFALKADDWLREFSESYKKEIGLPFNCYLRLDTVDDELLSLLKDAGCYSVHLSVDSCSKHIREKILNRKWKNVDIVEKLKLIHSYGINTWVNFMLAAPDSTVEDDLESIRVARRSNLSHLNYSMTIPLKNTELFDHCVENGLIDEDYDGGVEKVWGKSPLKCFSEREKDIRYNIFCLGPFAAKLPQPLSWIIMKMIKIFPSNKLFRKARDRYWEYTINRYIFKIEN